MNELVTVICLYTNLEQFGLLEQSLKKQTAPSILLGIDNRENKYPSNASAFNDVIGKVETEYVLFSHQDVVFPEDDTMDQLLLDLQKLEQYEILGVAGVLLDRSGIASNLKNGPETDFVGRYRVENGMEKTHVLDECIFGGHTKRFVDIPFDEKLCNGWHLYATDQCLTNYIKKIDNYISPVTVYHMSAGIPKKDFFEMFNRLCKKYKKDLKFIRSCTWESKTNSFSVGLNWLEWNVYKLLKGIK